MPRLRGNPARDPCPTQIGNVSNKGLQGLSQFVQVGAQLRHFLGLKGVHRCGIRATLNNTLRQYLGFTAERRYFIGGRRGELHNQGRQDLADNGNRRDGLNHSLGTIGSH
jgi:hypothetical protein